VSDGQSVRLEARVELFGSAPAPAVLHGEPRSRLQRRSRALGALFGSWLLLPIVFFIPPHAEWVLLVFFGGLYVARREWRAEYVVRQCEAACPRCGSALKLKPGSTLSLPHEMACPGCRRTCTLAAGSASEAASGRTVTHGSGFAPPSDVDVAELEAYWRRRSATSVWSPASSAWRGGWDRPTRRGGGGAPGAVGGPSGGAPSRGGAGGAAPAAGAVRPDSGAGTSSGLAG
jgi:hypothetical protein